jgi:hypothetical protein
MGLDWKNLQNLASNKFLGVEKKPGIYFIRWAKNEEPVILNRLGGSDSNGLLYIGESVDLRKRFQRIWRGIEKADKTSETTDTLSRRIVFCNLHKEIKSDEYEITWQHYSTKIEAQVQNAAALKGYIERFRELPPLNLQVCTRKYTGWGLNFFDQSTWSAEPNDFVKSIIS